MDIFGTIIKAGFGLAHIGKDRVELLTKDLKKHYGLNEKAAKKMAKDIVRHSVKSHKKVAGMVEGHFYELVEETGILTKQEINQLKQKTRKRPGKKKKTTKKKSTKKKTTKKKS